MLYTHKTISYNKNTIDRRTYNSTTPADITDNNLEDRIDAFQYQIKNEFVYRIPVRYFPDLERSISLLRSILKPNAILN